LDHDKHRRRARGTTARQTNDGGRAVPGKVSRGPFQLVQAGGFSGLGRIIHDKLDRGVVLLDARGRVLDANSLAVRVLEAGDGMALRSGRLVFADAALDLRLSRMIAQSGGGAAGATAVIAARVCRSGGASYRVVVTPVPRDADEREISTDVLRELYALTPVQSQAELLHLLAQGPQHL